MSANTLATAAANGESTDPLRLLKTHEGPCAALLLCSLHKTHKDLLDFEELREHTLQGAPSATGIFRMRASGRRMVIVINEMPEASNAPHPA